MWLSCLPLQLHLGGGILNFFSLDAVKSLQCEMLLWLKEEEMSHQELTQRLATVITHVGKENGKHHFACLSHLYILGTCAGNRCWMLGLSLGTDVLSSRLWGWSAVTHQVVKLLCVSVTPMRMRGLGGIIAHLQIVKRKKGLLASPGCEIRLADLTKALLIVVFGAFKQDWLNLKVCVCV